MGYEEKFMKAALKEALKAKQKGEIPVGAVIVREGKIVARGYNRREEKKNCLCHAELEAIDKACRKMGGWRLIGCDMYVTLEPCPMCAGAIINSRINDLYFGAYDKKAGCAGSAADLFQQGLFNHDVEVCGGKMEKECGKLLTDFFKKLRIKKKKNEG